MAYEPAFTIDVHHHPAGFFAACDPTGTGDGLLSHAHPMPGAALVELAQRLDAYLDGLAQDERRVTA